MTHHYTATIEWTGNKGTGTSSYRDYDRDHVIRIDGKPDILGSADPGYLGNAAAHNPEDMLVAALSACHMLWYLHLCVVAGVIVTAYRDQAEGTMEIEASGAGQFTSVVLRPQITLAAGSDAAKAESLHHNAHDMCFIARSVNFPVMVEPIFG